MRLAKLLGALAVLGSAVGCGGGGGPSSSSNVKIFLTDDLSANYSHVWVTIDKVQLVNQNGTLATVYNEPTGKVVDLRALNSSGTSLYALLGAKGVPAGTYTGMRLTLSQSLMLCSSGSTTGTPASFASTYNAGGGLSKLTFSFPAAVVVSGNADFYADFELNQWLLNGSTVTNAVVAGGVGPDDTATQVSDLYQGTVTSLAGTAPNYTFIIDTSGGQAVSVTTNASTGFYCSDGSSPTPAPLHNVSVRGAFSVDANTLTATSVRIDVAKPAPVRLTGVPSNVDINAQTFDLTLSRADGLLPASTFVHVVLDPSVETVSSVCLPFDRVPDFFTALSGSSASLCVEGTYNPTTTTLTATQIKFEDPSGVEGGVAEVEGTVLTSPGIDPVAGTFTLGVVKWSGIVSAGNTTLYIVSNGQTLYEVQSLASDKATFFNDLQIGSTNIRAVGLFNPATNTVTATLLWYDAP